MNGARGAGKIMRPRRKSQVEMLQPVLDYACSGGSGNGLTFGVCSVQGYRPHMEDRHLAEASISCGPSQYKDAAFFAVFDGHGGDWVSSYCTKSKTSMVEFLTADEQLTNLLSQQSPICDYRDCLKRLFLAYDRKIRREIDYQKNRADSCGSTCVMLLIWKKHLLLANCGDSRGVVYIDYGNYYNRITVDHSVSHIMNKELSSVELRTERLRFEGLRYEMDRERGLRRPNDKLGHGLMVTRSFGDYDFKGDDLHNLVSAEPSINHGTYFVKGHERLAVLASDGIWDVFSTEEVCEFALAQLRRRVQVQTVCKDIVQSAMEAGSRDNMTALVVCFDKNVQIGVESDVSCLRDETEQLLVDTRTKYQRDPSLDTAAAQRLLHSVADCAVRKTADSLFPSAVADSPVVRCFSKVCYFFWLRQARFCLEQIQRDPAATAQILLPSLAEDD